MPRILPKRKLTDQEKERVLFLATQGMDIKSIATELNINGQAIAGFIRSAINLGKLNPVPPHLQASPEKIQMAQTPPPAQPVFVAPQPAMVAPSPVPVPVPPPHGAIHQFPQQPPVYPSDGFTGGRSAQGYTGGWTNPNQTMRYQVERKVPSDGIVGQHTGAFSESDLCNLYGEGIYKVLRFEPGKPVPTEFEVKVGPNFGAPKYPKQGIPGDGYSRPRPWGSRPWERGSDYREDEEPRPGYGRPPSQQISSFDRGSRDHSLYEYARHSSAVAADANAAVTSEAIRALSNANERAIQQAEKAREGGPENFVTGFFKNQQDLTHQRWDEERLREADRRKDEDAKAERRQREMAEEHKRRQEDEEKKYFRELERIRVEAEAKTKQAAEERKLLMDLEDKKLGIIREEHKLRQEALQEELKRSREESKAMEGRLAKELQDLKERTEREMEASRTSVQEELDRRSEALDREHRLKEKSLDKEHELSKQILDIKAEQLQQQGGDQLFNTINTLIREFSKGLEKVVDLKKIQSMGPEAQAAAVASGAVAGNVIGDGKKPEDSPVQEQVSVQKNQGGTADMEKLVRDMIDEPFFKEVIKEWALHVESEVDPTTFANMYLEWMRDPIRHDARQACTMFANVMKVRSWKRMLDILSPKLEPAIIDTFKKPFATDFYDGFKTIVVEQIRVYFEEFLAAQKAQQAAAKIAGQAPPPAPSAPPQPTLALVKDEPAEEPKNGPPVPTREDLKRPSDS